MLVKQEQHSMSVSLIVLNWNGRHLLPDCLRSLAELVIHRPPEIIVVDNGSTDASVDYVTGQYPEVRLIRTGRNLGFSGGMNVGIAAANGDTVVLLNNDIVVEPDWLQELIDAMAIDSTIGIAGCRIYYSEGTLLQHAGGDVVFPLGYTTHYGYRQEDSEAHDRMIDVPYVTGAAMAIRRALLDEIGMLDEGFYPAYYEDVDICFRARDAGWRVVYVPSSRLTHFESATSVRDSNAYLSYFHRGRLRFVLKHLELGRFVTDFAQAEAARFSDLAVPRERLALVRAYREVLRTLPEIVAQRVEAGPQALSLLDQVADTLVTLYDELRPGAPIGLTRADETPVQDSRDRSSRCQEAAVTQPSQL